MSLVISAFKKYFRPIEELTISEWADKYRILPIESSESGRWRTSRTPYLKEIMDVMIEPKQVVVFK